MNDVKHIALIAGLWFAYSSSVYADADRVFINSKIITVNDQFAIEQAIACMSHIRGMPYWHAIF